MYCDYYGFREKPFNITPDPGFIFLSEEHREAFAHLLYGIDSHIGFVSLTGEIGTGKTTVIRTLLNQLSPDKYKTALLFNPCLSSLGLMRLINREFGLPASGNDTAELLTELNDFLLEENRAQRTVVLVVDEAQNLEPSVLEQIRLISNLETERDKLIQIVLVGQPELRDLLKRPELRQLGQRIGVSYHLKPMSLPDTEAYINHRIGTAGRKDGRLFSDGALRRIYTHTNGFPRVINLVCDRALLLGYTLERTPISKSMAAKAIADLQQPSRRPWRRTVIVSAAIVVAAVLASAALLFYPTTRHLPPTTPPKPDIVAETRALHGVTEATSGFYAFNAVAGFWKVAPATATGGAFAPEQLARERGLECSFFNGGLGTILKFGIPAILEISIPGIPDKRYVAVSGEKDGSVTLTPAVGVIGHASVGEMGKIANGRGYVLWRNHLRISPQLKPGSHGEPVKRLQKLLSSAGAYKGPLNGKMDKPTMASIRTVQQKNGIEETGIAGKQTLLCLYREADELSGPAPLAQRRPLP